MALGHALSVGAVVLIGGLAQTVVPAPALKLTLAAALIALGGYRMWRHRHPRFGGMQVGFRDLTLWSFLMASAHGAGLMLTPVLVGLRGEGVAGALAHAGHGGHAGHQPPAAAEALLPALAAVGLHAAAMLLVTGAIALVVYQKVGLDVLRRAWINLDLIWVGALALTGSLALGLGIWLVVAG